MRRYGIILACIVLAAILVGCGKKQEAAQSTATQQSAPAEAKPAGEKGAASQQETGPALPKEAQEAYPGEPKFSATAPKGTTTVTTKSGLQYQDIVVGKGEMPKPGDTIFVDYVGWFANGQRFDTTYKTGTPQDFIIGKGRVIPGWDEGMLTMRVGGRRRLVVPSDLAYGPDGNPPAIPPDATLTFEVHLLGVTKG